MSSHVEVTDLFAALGDRTRLAVLARLGSEGACSASALASGAPVSRQAIVKHLRVLEKVGLVCPRRRGREVLYAVDARRIVEARAFLEAMSVRWDDPIDRLRTLVEDGGVEGDTRSHGGEE
ncbi:MAG: winged helix-turn-helix transcriptional regulator [Chloroflexi bacterium]|nr:winged helix-turn-helix transcriptional regulator [Chloroflexota bacterium]